MKGTILRYRGSHKTHHLKQMLVQVEGVDSKDKAAKVIGKKIVWTSPSGKKISGKISAVHGGKGVVRVQFEDKGLPGQSLGQTVDVE